MYFIKDFENVTGATGLCNGCDTVWFFKFYRKIKNVLINIALLKIISDKKKQEINMRFGLKLIISFEDFAISHLI